MFRLLVQTYFENLQRTICSALSEADGQGQFREDRWAHPEKGGGATRVLEAGAIFEKAGVNFSAVESGISAPIAAKLKGDPQPLFATGVSLILHPMSPLIPTVHMNLRYLELANGDAWVGGGADLTPNYLHEEDVAHFHLV